MSITSFPLDSKGNPFLKPTFWLEKKEYGKIVGEINLIYYAQYADNLICAHASFGMDGLVYVYWFENHGFNDYNFFMRVRDNH